MALKFFEIHALNLKKKPSNKYSKTMRKKPLKRLKIREIIDFGGLR